VRVLADTHAWLWMLTDPDLLPARAAEVLADPTTQVFVSAASAWEIAIKYELGRLPLPEPPTSFVPARLRASGCDPLPIDHGHALAAGALPPHHRDPFDRLLISQSRQLRIPLCSGDGAVSGYYVEILWD